MRQYAGFASAEETNGRFRLLLERGQTGLSVAFDLPTQLGLDSDDPRAAGEVGRTGVGIDSVEDMARLFDGIPLGEGVSTSMTINAPASLLLLLYELVGTGQGADPGDLRGTIQNDILKEYCARGNYIFPPRPSMRLTTDTFRYASARLPRFNTISISGYHIREAGSTAVQELAFTLANGIAYVEAAIAAGLQVDDFAARLSFFFNAHNDVFQEIAKFRAARRLWAHIMRDRFGALDPRSQALRFHAQTGGSTLTAQQPEVNIVRVALQAFSAVAGGCQSLHTNGFDEALALPTEHSATLALRTQQVLAFEAGTTATTDPFGGSYYIEMLTDELERRRAGADRGDRRHRRRRGRDRDRRDAGPHRGGGVRLPARHRGRLGGRGRREPLPGPGPGRARAAPPRPGRRGAAGGAHAGVARGPQRRTRRQPGWPTCAPRAVASDVNLLEPMRAALAARCTIGEICEVLREEWGTLRRADRRRVAS